MTPFTIDLFCYLHLTWTLNILVWDMMTLFLIQTLVFSSMVFIAKFESDFAQDTLEY